MTDEDKKAYADRKCPKKCLNCEHRKIITHGVLPYNFCKKLNVSLEENMTDEDKKAYADRKCPKKCLNCEHRKIITHGVLPYNFCKKLNVSFTKNGPDDFLNCTKLN